MRECETTTDIGVPSFWIPNGGKKKKRKKWCNQVEKSPFRVFLQYVAALKFRMMVARASSTFLANFIFVFRLDAVNCKRVNVAGSQAASYLQRLLQLKYPGHLAAITLSRVEELLHEHSYTAVDYHEGSWYWSICTCVITHSHLESLGDSTIK